MKKILFGMVLLMTSVFGSTPTVDRFKLSNGIDVITYENYAHQAVVVGLVFNTGTLDLSPQNYGALRIILSNLLDESTTSELEKCGISCATSIHKEYSEIIAVLHPKYVNFFLKIICYRLSNLLIEDLSLIKKKILLEHQLNEHYNALEQQMNSSFEVISKNTKYMLNKKALNELSLDQVVEFYHNVFEKNHFSVIVCGAVNSSEVMKVAQESLAKFSVKKELQTHRCRSVLYKDITVANKFLSPSLCYIYNNRFNDEIADFAIDVFLYQLHAYLANKYIRGFSHQDLLIGRDNVFVINLRPETGYSLSELSRLYQAFICVFGSSPIAQNKISLVAQMRNNFHRFIQDDLSQIYQYLKKRLLSFKTINNKMFNCTQPNEEDIREYIREKIIPFLLCKITTKHKLSK